MRLGEVRTEKPFGSDRQRQGKVVYIHPAGRWYTVEFAMPYPGGMRPYRECFYTPVKPLILKLKREGIHRAY